jgi:hypothetical protein
VNRQPVKIGFTDPDTNLVGEGFGQNGDYVLGSPNTPSIAFVTKPAPDGFGIVFGPKDTEMSGYVAYKIEGGAPAALAAPVYDPISASYFVPIATRVYGRGYFVQALTKGGLLSGVFSLVIYDRFSEGILVGDFRLDFGRDGDSADSGLLGEGSSQREPLDSDFTYVNRSPVKFSTQDPDTNLLGEGAGGPGGNGNADGAGTWTQAGTTRNI